MEESSGPGPIELTKGAFVQSGRAAWAMTPIFVAIFAGFALLALWQAALTDGAPGTIDAAAGVFMSLVFIIASSGLTALLAVVVHRYVLLGEVAGFADLPGLAPVVLEFAAVTLIVQLIGALAVLAFVPVSLALGSGAATLAIATAAIVLAVYLGLRACLVFPAIAVQTPGRSLRSAFRASDGVVLRLFLAALLSALAIVAVAALVAVVLYQAPALAVVVGAAFDMAMIATSVAIASQVYAWRVENPAARADGEL